MTKSRDLANAATALNAVTAAELGFVDGVTSAIQTQMDAKLATATAATTYLTTSTAASTYLPAATAATTYVPNSLADAKGDLFVATADNTVTRLPVSTQNGDTIVADSSTSTGLRWQPSQTAGKNKILNSDMSIAQRGTSVALGLATTWSSYTLDRYKIYSANTATTVSRDTSAPTGFNYSMKLQRPNGNTGTNGIYVAQIIETANATSLAGQSVTLSFWIKKGANYSGGNLGVTLIQGTGTDQGGDPYGWTGITAPINDTSYSPTTSFVRLAYSGTVPSTAKELAVILNYIPSGTAGADDALYITGIQLEVGAMTTFQTATATIQGELAACQRYYYRQTADGTNPAPIFGFGMGTSGTNGRFGINLLATMRTTPSAIDFNSIGMSDGVNATTAITTITLLTNGTWNNNCGVSANAASGITQHRPYFIVGNGSSGGYLGLSAEL